jgi:acetoacetyl-CoA synthetase
MPYSDITTSQNGTGGTDVCSALVTAVETLPVYGGIIQGPVLGVALESWKEEGIRAEDGVGTMTVTRPIPNFPLGLLDDPDKKLYKETYFNDYSPKMVWNMADSIIVDHRGVNVIGRADGRPIYIFRGLRP